MSSEHNFVSGKLFSQARFKCRATFAAMILLASAGCHTERSGGDSEARLGQASATVRTGQDAIYEARIEDYSAFSNNGTDWGGAFQAFFNQSDAQVLRLACNKTYPVGNTSNALGACTSDGTEVPAAINVCSQRTIIGCGHSTVIEAKAGVSAFAIRAGHWCGGMSVVHGGEYSKLKDLVIREAGPAATRRFGVLLQQTAELEDVVISGFSNGIRAGGANVDPATPCLQFGGADHWKLRRVSVSAAEHAGIMLSGSVVNVGLGRSVQATGNCAAANKLGSNGLPLYPINSAQDNGKQNLWPSCAGIIDYSTVGNTWTALFSRATVGGVNVRFEPTAKGVCIGCFGDNAGSNEIAVRNHDLMIGGRAQFEPGRGTVLSRRALTSVDLRGATLLPGPENPPGSGIRAVMLLRAQDNTLLEMEQDGSNGLRGSYHARTTAEETITQNTPMPPPNGATQTAWHWHGSPAQWTVP
jgi:hypothetical protein